MSYLDEPLVDPAGIDTQQVMLDQQAARVAALRKMAAQPMDEPGVSGGWTSAVTGTRVPGRQLKQPWINAAMPALNNILADRKEREMNAARQKMMQQQFADQEQWIKGIPQGTPEVTAPLPPDQAGPTVIEAAKPASRGEILLHAMRGLRSGPLTRQIAGQYLSDQLIKEPEREEARQERVQARLDAVAEARRKQAEEIAYRRERDAAAEKLRRELAEDAANLRRDLKNAGGGGGGKASDYVIIQNADGTLTRINKLTGDRDELGGGGKGAPDVRKDANASRSEAESATQAINESTRVAELLDQGSASGVLAGGRKLAGALWGASSPESQADNALAVAADTYLKNVPRFEGPQSDKDTQSYKEAAGNLANPNISPGDRKAALAEIVRLQRKRLTQINERKTFSQATEANKRDMQPGGAASTNGGWSIEEVK